MFRLRAGGAVALLFFCLGGAEPRDAVVRQVQASDAMGLWLQTAILQNEVRLGNSQAATEKPGPASRPARLAYSEAFKGALQYVAESGAAGADPGIRELSVDMLRQELSLLHQQNMRLYVRLNAQFDELIAQGISPAPLGEPKAVAAAIAAAVKSEMSVRRRPQGSLLDALRRSDAAAPDYSTAALAAAEAGRAQSLEPPVPGRAKTENIVAAVMNNQPLPETFGMLSSVAPRNARLPGSGPLDLVSARSFPMMSFVPGTSPFEAIAPGNPEAVTPTPESVAYLASLTGLSTADATSVLQGRSTVNEALQRRGRSGEDAGALVASAMAPAGMDPRWQQFYEGPRMQQWTNGQGQGFRFSPGGGEYDRSDGRVNRDLDTRLNGEIDRRVNTGHDRRMNQQTDPRANY